MDMFLMLAIGNPMVYFPWNSAFSREVHKKENEGNQGASREVFQL